VQKAKGLEQQLKSAIEDKNNLAAQQGDGAAELSQLQDELAEARSEVWIVLFLFVLKSTIFFTCFKLFTCFNFCSF
jgi:hypothetical protein